MKRNSLKSPFLFFLALFFVTMGFPQSKEWWLKLERKGKGYGYDRITVEKLEDGNIKYQIYEVIKTDVAGFNPQEIIQNGFYIVDKDMNPVSLDLHIKFYTKEMHVNGYCKNDTLYLTSTDDTGESMTHEIPFHDVYFEVVLGNVIFRKKSESKFTLKVFNPIELKINDFHVEVTRPGENGIEATVKERITMKYQFDRKGRVQQIDFVELKSRCYLTDADDAKNIDYLSTSDGFSLTVKSKKCFPNVYRVDSTKIQVEWEGIPFEEFNFEDNRQKLISKSNFDRKYKVILEITKPSPPSKKITLPVKDENFAPFLEDTEYIKPSDLSIGQKLSEIQGDEKDPLTLVNNILIWIYRNVKKEYIAETLTGPEVLQKRRGKCSEYATLFASLARAAGIPTRIAFGEAINGEEWVGHLWCEVWLGEWTAVDAAQGIFVTRPSHIKFIDSATVMGTQKIRWKLVDNLSIEILVFRQ